MPRKPVSFSQAVIYKIVCKDLTIPDTYVGSTTNFIKRKYMHRHNATSDLSCCGHYLVYDKIKKCGGWDNWEMIELCKADECTNLQELHKKEREYLEKLEATLNKFIPGRTIKEYHEDNKEKQKEYYQNNKEKINEYHREYRKVNKDKRKPVDPEIKKQRNKQYYEKYKEQVKTKNINTFTEKYNNDPEFNEKVKQQRRERYLRKKIEAQNKKEDMLNKLSEDEKLFACVLEDETAIEEKKKRKEN